MIRPNRKAAFWSTYGWQAALTLCHVTPHSLGAEQRDSLMLYHLSAPVNRERCDSVSWSTSTRSRRPRGPVPPQLPASTLDTRGCETRGTRPQFAPSLGMEIGRRWSATSSLDVEADDFRSDRREARKYQHACQDSHYTAPASRTDYL